MSPRPEETPCPTCGLLTLEVGEQMVAKPLGSFSLAGNQMKFSVISRLIWRCTECGASGPAEVSE